MTELTNQVLGMVRHDEQHDDRGTAGLDPELLSILACPDSHHSPLTVDEAASELLCTTATGPSRCGTASRCSCWTRRVVGVAGGRRTQQSMIPPELAEEVLDDLEVMRARDPHGLLPAVAGAGAQVRETRAPDPRGRAGPDHRRWPPPGLVIVARREGAVAASVLRALLGPASPVTVDVVPGPALPVWSGPATSPWSPRARVPGATR
jgi:hypothetical protein